VFQVVVCVPSALQRATRMLQGTRYTQPETHAATTLQNL
jgi:hypothetical protein